MNINETRCSECGQRLKLKTHPQTGQRVICPSCGTGLIITSLNPVELDLMVSEKRIGNPKKRLSIVDVPCPECEHFLGISPHIHQGYRVRCRNCDTILEVISTNPLELDIAMTTKLKYSHQDTFDEDLRYSTRRTGRARR